jgi:DNA-binding NarL/FixJ family response regulator
MDVMQRNDGTVRFQPGLTAEPGAALRQRAMTNPAPSYTPRERQRAQVEGLRVLLVEDSPLLVQRISELVGDLPNVRLAGTASSEADAIARLESGDIDAVILDLQLHTGSGFGVLRALNRHDRRPTVIVFTNFAIGAYRDTALALGARHFLDKSRDYDRLPAVLRELSDSAH